MGHMQQHCDLWLYILKLASPAPSDKSTHKSLNGSLSQQYDSFSLPGNTRNDGHLLLATMAVHQYNRLSV